MGGFFGITSRQDCMVDVFFGVDYHSHLGTRRGGMAAYDEKVGLQRKIHNIENAPFRTKFENIFDEMQGTSVIGCIITKLKLDIVHVQAFFLQIVGNNLCDSLGHSLKIIVLLSSHNTQIN